MPAVASGVMYLLFSKGPCPTRDAPSANARRALAQHTTPSQHRRCAHYTPMAHLEPSSLQWRSRAPSTAHKPCCRALSVKSTDCASKEGIQGWRWRPRLRHVRRLAVARRGAVLGNRLALGRTGGCNNTGRCGRSFCPHPFGSTPARQSRR